MIPLGGYVRFLGDMNAASVPDPQAVRNIPADLQKSLFINKNVWQRIAVVVAGPAANVLFTFVVLYLLLIGFGRYTFPAVIAEVTDNSVAASAGIEPGDRVLSVDGYEVRGFMDFQRLVATAPERPVTVIVDRSGRSLTFTMTPRSAEITDRFGNQQRVGRIGVVSAPIDQSELDFYRPGPIEAFSMTFEDIHFIIDRTGAFIGDFFFGKGDVDQLGGPIKVAQVSGEVATQGIFALVNLAALLSLNIGLFNLLPIPMLDGGHLLYYLYEAAAGKPLSPKVQEWGFRAGLFLVLGLMAFTFVIDLT